MADMLVDLVAVEALVWSGRATLVIAQTTDGEIGILPGHEPVLGELVDHGVVIIEPVDGERLVAAVHGGFLSVTAQTVRILAESAELTSAIDADAARRIAADSTADEHDRAQAEGQLRAVNRA